MLAFSYAAYLELSILVKKEKKIMVSNLNELKRLTAINSFFFNLQKIIRNITFH